MIISLNILLIKRANVWELCALVIHVENIVWIRTNLFQYSFKQKFLTLIILLLMSQPFLFRSGAYIFSSLLTHILGVEIHCFYMAEVLLCSLNLVSPGTEFGGFRCSPGTAHLQCQGCGGLMPSRPNNGVPQHCNYQLFIFY